MINQADMLPELPEADVYSFYYTGLGEECYGYPRRSEKDDPLYTANQMQSYTLSAIEPYRQEAEELAEALKRIAGGDFANAVTLIVTGEWQHFANALQTIAREALARHESRKAKEEEK